MKILILGSGQHGKDEAALHLARNHGLNLCDTSRLLFDQVIWPTVAPSHPESNDEYKEKIFEDRRVYRDQWKKLLAAYNTPDPLRFIRYVLERNNFYIGLRSDYEYHHSKHLFDKIFYVLRPFTPEEPSMTIKYNDAEMIPIINLGPLQNMYDQLDKAMQ